VTLIRAFLHQCVKIFFENANSVNYRIFDTPKEFEDCEKSNARCNGEFAAPNGIASSGCKCGTDNPPHLNAPV
jgi:hypothetical protein